MTPTERRQAEAAGQLTWLVAELGKACTRNEQLTANDDFRFEAVVPVGVIRALIARVHV